MLIHHTLNTFYMPVPSPRLPTIQIDENAIPGPDRGEVKNQNDKEHFAEFPVPS